MLEKAARKLGVLNNEVVYLGGCSTALFITDSLSLDVRPTVDVDCIIDVASLSKYYQFGEKLKEQGFKQLMQDEVICRWRYEDIILDVMPTDEDILKCGNRWYKDAIRNAISHQIAEDLVIKSVTAPYLLATKAEAFISRGNGDFLGSHDFEDIITIIAGRVEIVEEIELGSKELRVYLKSTFENYLKSSQFRSSLPGHMRDGSSTNQRVQTILERIQKIANLTSK
jgi:hypothetical protein